MDSALLIIFYVLAPVVILYATWRSSIASKIGSVLIAYIAGLILGNSGLLNDGHKEIQDILTTITIPLALPLLLFSMNIKRWASGLKNTFLSLMLGIASLIIPVIGGFYLFGDRIAESWKVAGLLTGLYTGGTPNLAAIKLALHVSDETYILTHTYDMILSAFFLLFVLSIGQRVLLLWLRPYRKTASTDSEQQPLTALEPKPRFLSFLNKKTLLPLLAAIGASKIGRASCRERV